VNAARTPGLRIGQHDEIADALLFLAMTPFTPGSTMLVDGGCVIG
jgi:NAD(P)-dependent dehydrogenase (short-subunit alcohol dehydrogenase family)